MTDLLRFIRVLANLTNGIIAMQAELATANAYLVDQANKIADLDAKIDQLLAERTPLDPAALAEITAHAQANAAALDATKAKVLAALNAPAA
jgi:hypothetical protein